MEQQSKLSQEETVMEQHAQQSGIFTSRRSFLRKGLAVGGAGAIGAGLLANGLPVFAEERSASLTSGDIAILRFLSAAEILETDLGNNTTNLEASRTAKSQGGVGVQLISKPLKCWMGTCPSISTTIPKMSSPTSRLSMRTWFPKVLIPSIWISFAHCRAAKRRAPSKSDGLQTSCSSPWTPVGGRSIVAARRTPILATPFHRQSRVC
jgi:hypothetical protein